MRIQSIQIFRYSLPLVRPLILNRVSLERRDGLIVCLGDDQGRIGFGDVCPLSCLSPETYGEVSHQLSRLQTAISRNPAEITAMTDFEDFCRRQGIGDLFPSVVFGLETALFTLSLVHGDEGKNFFENMPCRADVAVNALAEVVQPGLLEGMAQKLEKGYRCFKIKVGRQDLATETSILRDISRQLPADVLFRLDGNRRLNLEAAMALCEALGKERVEYFEEPFAEPEMAKKFYSRTGIGVALDETLSERGFRPEYKQWACAFVLKPTRLGGWMGCRRWVQLAEQLGVKVIWSSAFESGLGLWMIARLAAAYQPAPAAMGLDTASWLQTDIVQPSFPGSQPLIRRTDSWLVNPPQLNRARLEDIDGES